MQIIKLLDQDSIKKTVDVLKTGGLVVFPSDTVYGLLVDATNLQAVKKLIRFKNRPPGKAISIFVSGLDMMKQYVEVTELHEKLLLSLLPGPYTIVLPSKHTVVKDLEAENGSLGVRVPMFEPIIQLVTAYTGPVTATSANLGGASPHYSVTSLLNSVSQERRELIDLIVDEGVLPSNLLSTVMDLTTSDVNILRKGEITWQNEKVFKTYTPDETKEVAKVVFQLTADASAKSLIFILQGDLGAGKTVFVQGIGELLATEKIISPTYVIYYEYEVKNKLYNKLYHFDLYQIKDKEEFNYFDIEGKVKERSIMCLEWGEKSAEIFEVLKANGKIVYVTINYRGETEREIKVNF